MNLDDLPAHQLADLIRKREVSAVEALEAVLGRVEAVDGRPGSLDHQGDRERSGWHPCVHHACRRTSPAAGQGGRPPVGCRRRGWPSGGGAFYCQRHFLRGGHAFHGWIAHPGVKLLEIVRTPATCEATYQTVKSLALKMGKTPITVADRPCFVTSRLIQTLINEAIFCLYEGVSTKEEIDTALKLGMNHPMGPLELQIS